MTEPKSTRCDTLVTLRDHMDQRFEDSKEALKIAKELMEARLSSSYTDLERRLHELNRLRENVMTKSEFESQHAALAAEYRSAERALRSEVTNIREWVAKNDGVGAEVTILKDWVSRQEGITSGKASTSSMYFAVVSGVVGLIIGLVGLIHSLWK
jgi:hypothetical protein